MTIAREGSIQNIGSWITLSTQIAIIDDIFCHDSMYTHELLMYLQTTQPSVP